MPNSQFPRQGGERVEPIATSGRLLPNSFDRLPWELGVGGWELTEFLSKSEGHLDLDEDRNGFAESVLAGIEAPEADSTFRFLVETEG